MVYASVARIGGGRGCLFEVQEGLAGQFGHAWVWVAKEEDDETKPAELMVFNANQGGVGHGTSFFSSAVGGNSAGASLIRNCRTVPIRSVWGNPGMTPRRNHYGNHGSWEKRPSRDRAGGN